MTTGEALRAEIEGLRSKIKTSNDAKQHVLLSDQIEEVQAKLKQFETTPVELDRYKPRKGEEIGAVKKTLLNTMKIFTQDPQWVGVLGFDERTRRKMFMSQPPFGEKWEKYDYPRPLGDADIIQARAWVEKQYVHSIGKENAEQSFELICRSNSYEPIREWMDSLAWDDEPRLDNWMLDYLGAGTACTFATGDEAEGQVCLDNDLELRCEHCKERAYVRAVSSKWVISGVARTYEPGCKVDHMLITDGIQGGFKSTTLRVMAFRNEWFTDHLSDLKNKDAVRDMQGPLIVEMAELDALRRQEAHTMKAFITRNEDDLVDKYEKIPVRYPRRCIFAGGTNESAYLKDHTGNRRYWPVMCDEANVDGLRTVVEQLWAEAKHRYEAGEKWWLEGPVESLARAQQGQRQQVDPWQPVIDEYIAERLSESKFTCFMDAAYRRLGLDEHKDRDQRTSMRIGQCFEARGWIKGSPRNDKGGNENGFSLPTKRRPTKPGM
jgi:putative DNA primase/helicase